MLLTIAILSGIGVILSIINHAVNDDRADVNLIFAAIFTIVTWNLCFPLAIIMIVISAFILIINLANR